MNDNLARYLTKSRFKLACECGTKLFYTRKPDIYPDSKLDDPFLAALADGGHQVGELAKRYFPGGHDIETLDYEEALAETNALLEQDEVVIYEPAINYRQLFIRVDVLVKKGNQVKLFEVKAKSFDKEKKEPFLTKKGVINADWKAYLRDVAFQTYVVMSAFPEWNVIPYLYLVDKNQPAGTSGLNQKFKLEKVAGRRGVRVSNTLSEEDLKTKLLIEVPVDSFVDQILSDERERVHKDRTFEESIWYFAGVYEADKRIAPSIKKECGGCEFYASDEELRKDKLSGKRECFKDALGWKESDFSDATIFELWDNRRKEKQIEAGVIKLSELTEDDIGAKADNKSGLSRTERQWMQVKKAKEKDSSPYIDTEGLKAEFEMLEFPLHFIDFETTMVPIPFNKGRKPYEGIAFQFSHHVLEDDGSVEHKNQFLLVDRGVYPNYEFVRELKNALGDAGSIFRYSSHENTYLNHIYFQMLDDESVEDKEELSRFIKSISKNKRDSPEKWQGERNMIDLCEWVKRYYFDPMTSGSNSIKKVLPAVLNSSEFIKEKYGQPIYGKGKEIPGLNFDETIWIQKDGDSLKDPYSLLPKLFSDATEHDMEALLYADDELKDGGAALTAYAKLQFTEMSDYEREELKEALLKYCELDTFAMVMIFEGLQSWVLENDN